MDNEAPACVTAIVVVLTCSWPLRPTGELGTGVEGLILDASTGAGMDNEIPVCSSLLDDTIGPGDDRKALVGGVEGLILDATTGADVDTELFLLSISLCAMSLFTYLSPSNDEACSSVSNKTTLLVPEGPRLGASPGATRCSSTYNAVAITMIDISINVWENDTGSGRCVSPHHPLISVGKILKTDLCLWHTTRLAPLSLVIYHDTIGTTFSLPSLKKATQKPPPPVPLV
jgi:hypothetical protein